MTYQKPLLIFDSDGTLVDSEKLYETATIRAYEEFGVPASMFADFHRRFGGAAITAIHQVIIAETGLALDRLTLLPRLHQHTELLVNESQLSPTPYSIAVVAQLASAGYALAVASNGYRPHVLASLASVGFGAYFPEAVVFTKCQVDHPKPAPDVYLHAADRLGFAPEYCVVIEDSVPGVRAGKAAGMRVIGYTGVSALAKPEESLRAAGADRIVSCFSQLANAIER